MDLFYFFLDFIKINIYKNYYFKIIIFFIFMFFYNIFSLPGNIIFMASAGYFFGIYVGFLLCITPLVLGSAIFFKFSKKIMKFFFPFLLNKFSNKVDLYISNSSYEYLIILRMIPGPPLILQNFFLSIININLLKFIITSFIGFIPIVFVSVFVGYQLNNIENIKQLSLKNFLSSEFLIFVFLIIIILFVRIFFKKKINF